MRKHVIVAICAISLIMSCLAGCSKPKEVVDEPENTAPAVEAVDEGNKVTISLLNINSASVIKAFNSIEGIKDNYTISDSSYRSLGTEGYGFDYAEGIVVDASLNEGVVASFSDISCEVAFKGDSGIPASIHINVEYAEGANQSELENYQAALFNKIIPEISESTIKTFLWNNGIEDFDTIDGIKIQIEKVSTELSSRNYSASSVSLYFEDTLFDGEPTSIDTFDMSVNPNFGLYGTGLMSSPDNLQQIEKHIADMFGLNYNASTSSISESIQNYDGETYSVTSATWYISNGTDVVIFDASRELGSSPTLSEDSYDNLYMSIDTFPQDSLVNCFYAAEDLVKAILGEEVELDGYVDSKNFDIRLDESFDGNAEFYPLILHFRVDNLGTEEVESFSMHISFVTEQTEEVTPDEPVNETAETPTETPVTE